MRGSWALVMATVPSKYCTAKSPPAIGSKLTDPKIASGETTLLEHVGRIQVFMCPTHVREISSDVLRYF